MSADSSRADAIGFACFIGWAIVGILLLPTLPAWIALMLMLWPVFLAVGLLWGLACWLRDRR